MSTHAVVDELMRRIAAGDADAIADVYAPEVDWQLDWPADRHGADIPWIRGRTTRADVAEHYRSIAAHHDPDRAGVVVTNILVDGGHAVLLGTLSNTVLHTGRSYDAHFALHLTVEDGLITRHHVYEDSLAVAEAWAG